MAEVLSSEFNYAGQEGLWGFARLFLFAKAVLRSPPRGGKKKRYVVSATLSSRLHQWQAGDFIARWRKARLDASQRSNARRISQRQLNTKRALFLARKGCFRDAMRLLNSQGCAREDNTKALEELNRHHPRHQLPEWTDPLTAPLCPDSDFVLETLKKFPRASSPGYSKLCPQHLLDAIVGTTAPSAQDCFESLTRWISVALSGKMDKRVTSWLTGAPLTALYEKQGQEGIRPIAVGETLHRLISCVC